MTKRLADHFHQDFCSSTSFFPFLLIFLWWFGEKHVTLGQGQAERRQLRLRTAVTQ